MAGLVLVALCRSAAPIDAQSTIAFVQVNSAVPQSPPSVVTSIYKLDSGEAWTFVVEIIKHRPYKNGQELQDKVKGIGPKTWADLKNRVTFGR